MKTKKLRSGETAKLATRTVRRATRRRPKTCEVPEHVELSLKTPPILLEGDGTSSPLVAGPGQKYALGPAAAGGQVAQEEAALPEAYGTGKLLLAARDPHWLYAHWDLTLSQQRHYNALSADRHLVVRVYPRAVTERPVREVHVHPESRHWFVHVDRADSQYVAELGYYPPGQQWMAVAISPPTVTPVETVSSDQTVQFATIPAQVPLSHLAAPTKQSAPAGMYGKDASPRRPCPAETGRLGEASLPGYEKAREHTPTGHLAAVAAHPSRSQVAAPTAGSMTPALASMEGALAELVGLHLARQDGMSSAEVGEVVRGRREHEIGAGDVVQPAAVGAEAEGVSSPSGAPEQQPGGFWFSVNAELVVYGATEPDATVMIDGQLIQLRPDGTFSCRFALPDGEHVVTLSAISAQGDSRQAELKFGRHTEYRGEVGVAPQDQSLEPPGAKGF